MTIQGRRMRSDRGTVAAVAVLWSAIAFISSAAPEAQARTQKPALHGQHWMAVTGKPLAATAGAMIFQRGGNAVDAACAMLAAVSTMWDTLSWGGETQALIYDPIKKKVIGINALGVAPTGATPELFKNQNMKYPPEFGALFAAYDRFYKGDIATELVRSVKEQGGLFTMDDLAQWHVKIEEPVSTSYRGVMVYKLTTWVQGPAMLQALNILENMDLKAMGYN